MCFDDKSVQVGSETHSLHLDGRVEEFVQSLAPGPIPIHDFQQVCQFVGGQNSAVEHAKQLLDSGAKTVQLDNLPLDQHRPPAAWTAWKGDFIMADGPQEMYVFETKFADSDPGVRSGQAMVLSKDGQYVRWDTSVVARQQSGTSIVGHESVGKQG